MKFSGVDVCNLSWAGYAEYAKNPHWSPPVIEVQHQGEAEAEGRESPEYFNKFGSENIEQEELNEVAEKRNFSNAEPEMVHPLVETPPLSAPFQTLVDLKERIVKREKKEKLRNRQKIKRAVKISVSMVKEVFKR